MYRRKIYLPLIPAMIVFGLAIRAHPKLFPPLFVLYAPDILWAALVFAIVGVLLPRAPTAKIALIALGFCFFMECSQLYQAPWINALRADKIGGLLLGFGFLWSDLICYFLGVALGAAFDWVCFSIPVKRNKGETP